MIALDPRNASALNYLGYTYADLGQNLDEAERLILEALKIQAGRRLSSPTASGWVYYKKGDYPKALHHLKKAAEIVPERPRHSGARGGCLSKAERQAERPQILSEVHDPAREGKRPRTPKKPRRKKRCRRKIRQLK
ncbi:MAG: tetratricopeptide repeat protein [Desulfobacterales bacterium]|nr:tetratricopeptide repeat protein [Desulfobacterales bacterium]